LAVPKERQQTGTSYTYQVVQAMSYSLQEEND